MKKIIYLLLIIFSATSLLAKYIPPQQKQCSPLGYYITKPGIYVPGGSFQNECDAFFWVGNYFTAWCGDDTYGQTTKTPYSYNFNDQDAEQICLQYSAGRGLIKE